MAERRDGADIGRVAVITGGSSGIGAALGIELGRRGWHCVLLARREARLQEVAAACGGEYEVCDLSDREQIDRAAQAILGRHRAVHLLVSNAGIPARGGFVEIEPAALEQVLRVNFLAGVWCMRAFLPGLEAAERADVVNVVSVAGTVAFPPAGPYSASKHAQLAFSRSLGGELAGRGIRVHTVNPGFVETEGFPQRARFAGELMRRLVIDPEDVARHIVSVVERDRRETFVPWWYRGAMLAQAVAPGLVSRVFARRR